MDKREFPASFDHTSTKDIYQEWEQNKLFTPNDNKNYDGTYVIPIPPPNVTGDSSSGTCNDNDLGRYYDQTCSYEQQKALRVPGTDHAGISTQVVVEKKVAKEEGKSRHQFERSEFINKIRDRAGSCRSTIINQLKLMGSSCDWSREQFTLSENFLVQ
jgi:valyl-tRNA synthetase